MSKNINNRIYLETCIYKVLSDHDRLLIPDSTVNKINKVPFNILERILTMNPINMHRFIKRMR